MTKVLPFNENDNRIVITDEKTLLNISLPQTSVKVNELVTKGDKNFCSQTKVVLSTSVTSLTCALILFGARFTIKDDPTQNIHKSLFIASICALAFSVLLPVFVYCKNRDSKISLDYSNI